MIKSRWEVADVKYSKTLVQVDKCRTFVNRFKGVFEFEVLLMVGLNCLIMQGLTPGVGGNPQWHTHFSQRQEKRIARMQSKKPTVVVQIKEEWE